MFPLVFVAGLNAQTAFRSSVRLPIVLPEFGKPNKNLKSLFLATDQDLSSSVAPFKEHFRTGDTELLVGFPCDIMNLPHLF